MCQNSFSVVPFWALGTRVHVALSCLETLLRIWSYIKVEGSIPDSLLDINLFCVFYDYFTVLLVWKVSALWCEDCVYQINIPSGNFYFFSYVFVVFDMSSPSRRWLEKLADIQTDAFIHLMSFLWRKHENNITLLRKYLYLRLPEYLRASIRVACISECQYLTVFVVWVLGGQLLSQISFPPVKGLAVFHTQFKYADLVLLV